MKTGLHIAHAGAPRMHGAELERRLHTPTRDPGEDEDEPDVKQPPVPPDQDDEVVPQRDPPQPGEHTPMIA
jgi:hypothetical protein